MLLTSIQSLTFLVQALLLIKNNELAVLVGFLQNVLALLDVAVVVLKTEERGHQGHVCLNRKYEYQTFIHPVLYC